MSINKILLELAADSSRLSKENILDRNKESKLLRRVVQLALDPYLNFFVKKIPAYTPDSSLFKRTLEEALDELNVLSSRKLTGHAAINHLVDILSSLSVDDAEVIVKIIRRDLRCGVSTATVNKTWENLVPKYSCLLCSPYDEKVIKNIKWPAYVQLKADGLRFNAIVRDGVCQFYSRKGSLIELKTNTLADAFILLADGKDLVFDGEMLAYKDGKLLPRKEGNGIANKAIKGTISEAESDMLGVVLWDVIPFGDFRAGACAIVYEDRFATLSTLVKKHNINSISLIETHVANSLEEANKIFNEYLEQGLEGAIIKNKKSLWSDTRSKEQIKLKAERVCELRVIGWNYGEPMTKNEHRLGSLLCASEDGKVVVNISGFTDEQRDTITKENSIDRIVSVMYNEKIAKKDSDVYSLFLPRVVEFRDDKDVADTNDQIK